MTAMTTPLSHTALMTQVSGFADLHQWYQHHSPEALSGWHGSNRAAVSCCRIRAEHDYDAIHCWLNEYQHTPTTYRHYQKESERFLLWALIQQQKPLSSLDREDLAAYIKFLAVPPPEWCAPAGGRGRTRQHPAWRPFTGPLSVSAQSTAIAVVDSLLSYLVEAGYLQHNPLGLIRKKQKRSLSSSEQQLKLELRILAPDEWEALLEALETWPAHTPHQQDDKARLRFIVMMLYFLALRINELATHGWNAFRQVEGQWWFIVLGKGNKLAKIPVNDACWQEVIRFRRHLHLSEIPNGNENTPLVPAWKSEHALTPRQINKCLKALAVRTIQIYYQDQPDKAEKLQKFSAHWIRHYSASKQDRVGISFKHIRANLRHENDETTRRYVHAWDQERAEEMQKLTLK